MGGICAVNEYYVKHPALDKGARKLSGVIKDRINPESWTGDVNPTGVDVAGAWAMGAALAGRILRSDNVYSHAETDYAAIRLAEKATMLEPLGPVYEDEQGVRSGPGYGDNGRPGVSKAILPCKRPPPVGGGDG